MKSIAAVHRAYGIPKEVLRAEEIDVPFPKKGQVLVKLLRASINPSDLGMIGGSYGRLRELPAIAGREGVGEVVELGEGVEYPPLGARVRIPEDPGVWTQYQVCAASDLMVVPSDLPLDMLAMAFVNPPTAVCILEKCAELSAGDWFIQNGAGSALGYFLIQMCRARGIKTVNMLRNAASKEAALKAAGADIVVDESEFDAKRIKLETGGRIKLGLNQIGGESVSNMIKAAGDSATIITVGGMVGTPIKFPTRFLIFNNLTLRGFWWDKWRRTHTKEEVGEIYGKVFSLIKSGVLRAPVDSVFPMSRVAEAVARASENGRNGKVLLEF